MTLRGSIPFLIVGLGNPEKEHFHTRHNIGFLAIDYLAEQYHAQITTKKFDSLYAETRIQDNKVLLLKPLTYMNLSGKAVVAFKNYLKIPTQHIIVIHDEIDLPFGDIREKLKGGHAGHNGVKSVVESLNTDEFYRIRIGIGRPSDPNEDVSNYVLSPFSTEQKKELPNLFEMVQKKIEKIVIELNNSLI